MKSILYLTDFAYQAKGRRYCDEDILITSYLRGRFDVTTCHPSCCEPFEDATDLVVFRNAGAVAGFKGAYDDICALLAQSLIDQNHFESRVLVNYK